MGSTTSSTTGSYRRATKTKPLKDVDMFVVIDLTGPQGYLRDEMPSIVLAGLLKVLQVKWPNAFIDGMAGPNAETMNHRKPPIAI